MSKKPKGKGKDKAKPKKVVALAHATEFSNSGFDSGFMTTADTKWLSGAKGPRCYESHPELKLGGGVVLGASCNHPRPGYDIYVGLDWGMDRLPAYPWEPPSGIVEVYFPVRDGSIPKNVAAYVKMIAWLKQQLALGRRIHMGCIGGHGRTGTLLAALVKEINGDENAGEWVRKNYCKSAIETNEQVKFLTDQFGIKPIASSKGVWSSGKKGGESAATHVTYSPLPGRSVWALEFVSHAVEIA